MPVIYESTIRTDWIDRNGHFNAGFYMVLFDEAIGWWHAHCGLTDAYRAEERVATFTAESHTTYQRELEAGEAVVITGQLLGFTDKKIHTFLEMFQVGEGFLAATNEVLSLHVSMDQRRVAAMSERLLASLAAVAEVQREVELPPESGRVVSLEANRPRAR